MGEMQILSRSLAGAAAVVVLGGGVAACGSSSTSTSADGVDDAGAAVTGEASPPLVAGATPDVVDEDVAKASDETVLAGRAERLTGGSEDLAAFRGDVVLVVNTASQCGFTPQFAQLQELYAARSDEGLTILGFPSDSFDQELDDAEAISEVCEKNFGVRFPMFAKTSVTGEDAHPLFRRLAAATGEEPRWNFNKYLLDREGNVVGRFDSGEIPQDEIDRLLAAS
jgi:glutathione peroxidase